MAILRRNPFVCELVTENSGEEVDDDEHSSSSWLEEELSESDESDWLHEPDASLTEF